MIEKEEVWKTYKKPSRVRQIQPPGPVFAGVAHPGETCWRLLELLTVRCDKGMAFWLAESFS
jgi:hypothetical protein